MVSLKHIYRSAKDFMSDPFNRFVVILVLALAFYAWVFSPVTSPVAPQQYSTEPEGQAYTLDIHFFYHPACPHCKSQMPVNQMLAEEYTFAKWTYHDISHKEEDDFFTELLSGLDGEKGFVPTTVINQTVIVGYEPSTTPGLLREAILASNASASLPVEKNETGVQPIEIPFIGQFDPSNYSLFALALILGFIDGFNPCAMWVLIYLISLTLTLHDRKKLFLVVGTFLLASGVLYFLIMAAWLNAFLFVGYLRVVMVIVGALAIGWGLLSLREFIHNKGKVVCNVGDTKERGRISKGIQEMISSPVTWATFGGLVALAFTVNSIEFICSAAIPAVFTQVLALQNVPALQYYGYIALYVIMYMLDDLIVFTLAFLAVGGALGEKVASWGHAIGAIILLALGLLLLFAPGTLMV